MLSSELNNQNLTYAERASQMAVQPEPSVSTREFVRCRCDCRGKFSYRTLSSATCSRNHDYPGRYRGSCCSVAHRRLRFAFGYVFRGCVLDVPAISYCT